MGFNSGFKGLISACKFIKISVHSRNNNIDTVLVSAGKKKARLEMYETRTDNRMQDKVIAY